jgi:hypothetical protein
MKKLTSNPTDETRWTVVQVGPTARVIGHYKTEKRATAACDRHLARPHGSGVGPIVRIYRMEPGEFLYR